MYPDSQPNVKRQPNPDLSPIEVVEAQLLALKWNDQPHVDHGIVVAYNFASPANKMYTGPLERFKMLVRNPLYVDMLYWLIGSVDAVYTDEDQSQVRVRLLNEREEDVEYIFILSRQNDGPLSGCWLTDSVMRLE